MKAKKTVTEKHTKRTSAFKERLAANYDELKALYMDIYHDLHPEIIRWQKKK